MAKRKTRRYANELYETHLQFHGQTDWVTGGNMPWKYMPYGKERRVYLINHLRNGNHIYVNKKWQLQTKHDSDLKKLLKKGVLRIVKEGSLHCRQSRVELTNHGR